MGNDRRIDISELFDDDYAFAEAGGIGAGAPKEGVLDLVVLEGTGADEPLELDPDSVRVSLRSDDPGDVQLSLQATVHNRTDSTLEIGDVHVAMRDAAGRLLEHETNWTSTKFTKSQELVLELGLDFVDSSRVARVDLYGAVRAPFQTLLASADLGPVPLQGRGDQRRDWPVHTELAEPSFPGYPRFEVEVFGVAGVRWDAPWAGFLVKLTETTPSLEQHRDVVVALRDSAEKLIAKETVAFRLPGLGEASVQKVRFPDLGWPALNRVARLDLAAKGEVERVIHLGSFEVQG